MTPEFQPYVGPKPFEEKHKDLFFGREAEANDLFSLIVAHQAVLVYAQSGAGKTSLLNAKVIPSLKGEAYEVLPIARVQGIENENAANVYAFNTLISWADGQSEESPELARMSLAEFLKKRPHVQKVRELVAQEPDNKDEADNEVLEVIDETQDGPAATEAEAPPELWELPRVAVFDQFEELFTSYPHRWKEREAFFKQIREALDDDYLLRVVFMMREDYIAELDPYVSMFPGDLRVRVRLERLGEKSALDAVVKPLLFTNRKFGDGVARTLVHNLMKSSNGHPGVEQFVEAVQLQVVCQNLWQSLEPNDTEITLTHLEKCGDVKRALMSFYEKSIQAIVGEKGVADGKARITEADLRRWFGTVLITPEKKRATVDRRAERTGGMPNTAIIVPLEKVQLIKGEWRAGARWYELSHDRFIEPILLSNQKWLEDQSASEQIHQRLELRAVEYVQGGGTLLTQDELVEAKRLQANQRVTHIGPSQPLRNLIQASLVPEQKRKLRFMTLGVAALLLLLLGVSGLAVFAVEQKNVAENAKTDLQAEKNRVEQLLASEQQAKADAKLQERIAKQRLGEAQAATKEANKQRSAAEQARADAKNAESKARHDSKDAREFGAEATERTVVAEAEKLIDNNKDLTSGGLLLIRAAEFDKRRLQNSDTVSMSELTDLKALARDAERRSLLQELKEDSLTHHAREIVRRMVSELSRQPEVLRAGQEVNAVTVSPDGNYIVLITRNVLNRGVENNKQGESSVWEVAQQDGRPVGAEEPRVHLKYKVKESSGGIVSAAFSSNSKYLVMGGTDDKSRVLESSSGVELATLEGHEGDVTGVAFVPGHDDLVLTTSEDKTIRFWHWQTKAEGDKLEPLRGHGAGVHALAFDRSGKYLATEAADGTAHLWNLGDIANGKPPISITLKGLLGPHTALAFSPTGDKLVTEGKLGCGAYVAFVWDTKKIWESLAGLPEDERVFDPDPDNAQNCQPSANLKVPGGVFALRGHRDAITSVTFSSSGKLILTGSADETGRVWDAASGSLIAELRGHTAPLTGATFNPDDKYIVTSALDKTARLWDTEGNNFAILRGHRNGLMAAEISSNGKFIVTASKDGTARVWDTPKEQGLPDRGVRDLRGHTGSVYSVAFSPDGKLLLTGSFDSTARLWEPQTGQQRKNAEDFVGSKAAFNREGNLLVTAAGNEARIYRRDSDDQYREIRIHERDSNGQDQEIKMRLPHPKSVVYSAAFSANSHYIVTTSRLAADKGMVKVWKEADHKWELESEIPQSTYLFNAEFSPTNDKRIVTAGLDGQVRIWEKSDTGSWSLLKELTGHQKAVISASFSPDGNQIVTASWDGTGIVWRQTAPDKWDYSFSLRGHVGAVYSAAFSLDGNYIVTAGGDKTAGVWKKTGDDQWELLSVLSDQEDVVFAAAFSADGQYIATASADGKARIYSKVMFEPFADVLRDALKLKPYLCRVQENRAGLPSFCDR